MPPADAGSRQPSQEDFSALAAFIETECGKRLRAYEAQPRDANEHFETEIEVLSGGYAYRQLFELVQNAADAIHESGAQSGRIHVRLEQDRLIAANTGAALDEGGIIALLNARSSAKRAGQIGRFGIGFKSLLKLGGVVDIVSRSVGMRFDPEWCREKIRAHLGLNASAPAPGMRLAQVLDPRAPHSPLLAEPDLRWATTIVSAQINDTEARRRLSEEMANFPPEFVLFLEAEVELTLTVVGGETRRISKRRDGDFLITDDGTRETRWRLFEKKVSITDPLAISDAQHLQARSEVPLAWAVPLSGREIAGHFWAFFPTQTPTLASGILNAPWKLNSDRTNVIQGAWNECLMREAAALIADNIAALATPDDPGAPIAALPRRLERQDEIAATLVNALWSQLVAREFVANAQGDLLAPKDVCQHPIDEIEAINEWVSLAGSREKSIVVHPSCYLNRLRVARLEALAREAQERLGSKTTPVMRKLTQKDWVELIAKTGADAAILFLKFVGKQMLASKLSSYQMAPAKIIPTEGETLVSASAAIIASPTDAPAGRSAVLQAVAQDQEARKVLIDCLHVDELNDENWDEVLERAYGTASNDEGWKNFWRNIEAAPSAAVANFFEEHPESTIEFKSLAGPFAARSELLVLGAEEAKDVPSALVMDQAWHAKHWKRIPPELREKFPPIEWFDVDDWTDPASEKLKPYLRSVESAGYKRMTGNPHYHLLGVLSWPPIRMPDGWKLLASLPPMLAAQLTSRLSAAAIEGDSEDWQHTDHIRKYGVHLPPILYGHKTRGDQYPKFSAPHPLLFWLNEFGWVDVQGCTVPLKALSKGLGDVLEFLGEGTNVSAKAFFSGLAISTDLNFKFSGLTLPQETNRALWSAIFTELEAYEGDFTYLRQAWEISASNGYAPEKVPTTAGPLSLTEIFVTVDEATPAKLLEDGRVILLSPEAMALWEAAGAQSLSASSSLQYDEQLGIPERLRNMFPELSVIFDDKSLASSQLKRTDATWVRGLTERSGHVVAHPLIARDSTGLLLVEREKFESESWQNRTLALLEVLFRYGLVVVEPSSLMGRITANRVAEARAKVREMPSLAARLLCAVGGSRQALMDTLPAPAKQAAGAKIAAEPLAELTLAVHGPTVLSRLSATISAEGLSPPSRWGGEAARQFALELGFPSEFGASASIRRDAEMVVSGPLLLPPLHDYQEDILDNLRDLISSKQGRRRAIVSLPTGGGKTRVAAEAIVKLVLNGDGKRTVLWVAQTDELCEQAVQCFRQLWVNVGLEGVDLRIVRLWGGQSNPAPPEADEPVVVIASIQTLNARLEVETMSWLSKPGIVVIDECHHAIAPSYSSLLRWLDVQTGGEAEREKEPPVIGLSATPWRGRDDDESSRLAARFDRRWLPSDQERLHTNLRERGVLAALSYSPINYDRPINLTDDAIRYFNQYGELPEILLEEIGADPERNELIISKVLESDCKSILLFSNSVKHAQYLAARLHLAGCAAAAVSGETDRLARQHFIRRFRSGELRVLCNHSVLTTGFDAPKADMILISRPVFSPVRYMQMVGRGLRGPANGGTDSCEIATVEDNILSFRDRLAYHFCRRFFDAR